MQPQSEFDRRRFLGTVAASGVVAATAPRLLTAASPETPKTTESLVAELHKNLTDQQRQAICFDWNHRDPQRGLLRTFVANNWNIVPQEINSDFYSDDQRDLIRVIFESMISPDWHARYYQQLEDDAGGFGNEQSIAIFGNPGDGKYQMVMTGRHMTLRCDGNSTDHMAFGGPIFYGHAPDFNEGANHTGNVFWEQAIAANNLYKMLDGRQRALALLDNTPREQDVAFRGGKQAIPGIPVTELAGDQREHVQKVLDKLIEPYRQSDQEEVIQCLKTQGGLDACRLAFYKDQDIGDDGVWDNWRLEGPSFVWHFRGAPHVHVWVNVADSADVVLNA
ncbi:DUF3500 domain-containing protein [Planctomycetaceae bacterium SH139]